MRVTVQSSPFFSKVKIISIGYDNTPKYLTLPECSCTVSKKAFKIYRPCLRSHYVVCTRTHEFSEYLPEFEILKSFLLVEKCVLTKQLNRSEGISALGA